MAKATKAAAPKKAAKEAAPKKTAKEAAPKKTGGAARRRISNPGRSSDQNSAPHKDAPVCTYEKDQSEYAQ